jgi:hypothetical protein
MAVILSPLLACTGDKVTSVLFPNPIRFGYSVGAVATETITDVLHDLAKHGYIEYPPEPDFSTLRDVRRAQRYAESVDPKHWAFMCELRARKRVALAGRKVATA